MIKSISTEVAQAVRDTLDPQKGGGRYETFICIIALIVIIGMFVMEAMGLQTPVELKTTLIVLISFIVGKNTKVAPKGTEEDDFDNFS